MFDNPVVWKKTQRDEQTQVNIMSNIVEPFLDTTRLSVSFIMDSPVYRTSLRIRGGLLHQYHHHHHHHHLVYRVRLYGE